MFDFCRKKISAYTLAEMLIVLLIFSILMLAAPPLTKKFYKVSVTDKKHGRFECYYNSSGDLVQYLAVDGNEPVGPKVVEDSSVGCVFNPPSNVLYIMIHAVGGGGAGYSGIGVIGDTNNAKKNIVATSYLSYSAIALWPEWFKYLMNHNESSIKVAGLESDAYEIKKTFVEQAVQYGNGGLPGERVSMFFPALSSKIVISMKPGLGALTDATEAGGDTYVYFKYPTDDDRKEIIVAEGGKSGSKVGKYSNALSGGIPTDFGIGNFQSVKMRTSTFEDVIENANSKQVSMINDEDTGDWTQKAGWGGNGAYFYLGGDALKGTYTYQANNYSQVIDSDGNFIKNNNWKTVTSLLPTHFYKRDGQTGNCSLDSSSKPIELSGSCYKPKNVNQYKCTIDSISSIFEANPTSNPNVYNLNRTYYGSSLTSCKFDNTTFDMTCTKNVAKSTHNCTAEGSLNNFSCPDGVTADKTHHSDGYGICKATRGGNGAVIILW